MSLFLFAHFFQDWKPHFSIFEGAVATRVESCIGPGAHTHYWDRTAPDVAQKLNELI
jgi:hypothetical protein